MTVKNATKNATTPKEVDSVAPKKRTDWQAVERDFRTDKFTLRELEDKHGPNCGTISRRAHKEGWTKDLSAAIKQATNAKLINAVLEDHCINAQQNTTDTVLAAAEINKDVILGHRKGLSRLTAIKAVLLGQIEQAAANMPDLAEVIEMVRNEGENGMDRANDALRKSMSRSALVDDLKKLADVDEKVRKGEREAFGLNDAEAPEKSELDSLLNRICSSNNSAFGVVHDDPDHDED